MKKGLTFFMVGFVMVLMYTLAPTSTTAQAQTVINATEGTPTLDGIVSPGEWTSNSVTTTRGVTIQSMIDDDNFYVLATWPDTASSVLSNQWTFDGTNWTQTGTDDEDRVMFIWDMGLSGTDLDGGCTAFCHIADGNMFTNNPGDRVDVWHWKAARFNAMGFSDDKYWDDVTRRSDNGAGSGASVSGPPPAFMAATDPGASVTFLTDSQTARNAFDPFGVQPGSVDVKTAFNAAGFTAGAKIAGRILALPSGNRASVKAAGKWFNNKWTVEFSRSVAGEVGPDGNVEDFAVVRGGSVKFSNEIFDNVSDHAAHAFTAGGSGPADMVQAYTINFPAEMTVLVANFMNGNNAVLESRVYLYNGSNQAGDVTVRVFTLPVEGGLREELTVDPLNLGSLGINEGFNIKLDDDILANIPGVTLPYTDHGGNVLLEITVKAPNVTGTAQVFSGDLAFGTYPLQVIQ
jgi:hypothetical protein